MQMAWGNMMRAMKFLFNLNVKLFHQLCAAVQMVFERHCMLSISDFWDRLPELHEGHDLYAGQRSNHMHQGTPLVTISTFTWTALLQY